MQTAPSKLSEYLETCLLQTPWLLDPTYQHQLCFNPISKKAAKYRQHLKTFAYQLYKKQHCGFEHKDILTEAKAHSQRRAAALHYRKYLRYNFGNSNTQPTGQTSATELWHKISQVLDERNDRAATEAN